MRCWCNVVATPCHRATEANAPGPQDRHQHPGVRARPLRCATHQPLDPAGRDPPHQPGLPRPGRGLRRPGLATRQDAFAAGGTADPLAELAPPREGPGRALGPQILPTIEIALNRWWGTPEPPLRPSEKWIHPPPTDRQARRLRVDRAAAPAALPAFHRRHPTGQPRPHQNLPRGRSPPRRRHRRRC